jgi:long-chain acyl-CoA synthetase
MAGNRGAFRLPPQPPDCASRKVAAMPGPDLTFPPRPVIGVTSLLARTAQVSHRHTATIDGARQRVWGEVADRVARAAAGIHALGVRDGDRVAVLAATSDRQFELFAAVPHAGGVMVSLNWRWSLAELADSLVDAEPVVLFTDKRMLEMGRALAAGRPEMTLASIDDLADGLPHYDSMIANYAKMTDAGRGGDQLYQLAYTGGTTGRAKAAMLSHRNVIAGSMSAYAERFYREDAVYLFGAPMFHASGSWPCIALMGSGGTGVLIQHFDPGLALKLIEQHRVTESLLVPAMIQMLIEHPDFASADKSSFKTVLYGAAPITEALLDRALAAFPNTRFTQAYGMTELSPMCAVLHHEFLLGQARERGRHRAAGRAIYGVKLRVVNPDGIDVAPGEIGEICASGENVMLGYWRRPEETAAALRDGWMHTGDNGWMDEDGFLYIVDRVKDMIITGGENVYSVEVENAVARHPAIRQCVVIGIPSEKWGEQVHAIVRLHEGMTATEAEIIAHTRTLIAGYKVPRSVTFYAGEFPRTPANKILKRELRAPYWEGRERKIV